jgi:hypothetical protein
MERMAMLGVGRGRLIDGVPETRSVALALFSEDMIPLFGSQRARTFYTT